MVIVLGYLLVPLHFNPMLLASHLIGGKIGQKIILYTTNVQTKANVLSIYSFSKLFILLILYWKIEIVSKVNKYAILLIKIQSLSIISLCFFSQNLAAAMRISEYFSVADILLFPLVVTVFKEKRVAKILLGCLCLIWLSLRIFRYKLILL